MEKESKTKTYDNYLSKWVCRLPYPYQKAVRILQSKVGSYDPHAPSSGSMLLERQAHFIIKQLCGQRESSDPKLIMHFITLGLSVWNYPPHCP